MTEHARLVRRFIMSLPGHFDGASAQEAAAAAYSASGLSGEMTLAEFRGQLHMVGHVPVCVRTEPMLYRLSLPDGKSPGVKARGV